MRREKVLAKAKRLTKKLSKAAKKVKKSKIIKRSPTQRYAGGSPNPLWYAISFEKALKDGQFMAFQRLIQDLIYYYTNEYIDRRIEK